VSRTVIEFDQALQRRRVEAVSTALAELRQANAGQNWCVDLMTVRRVLEALRRRA
jgi:hypothetical protein